MGNPETPALVFGDGVSALAVLRSLGRNGIPVFVAGSATALVGRSRWFRPAPGDSPETEDTAPYLETLPYERAVLIPCNDEWARALAQHRSERHPAIVAPAEVLRVLVDKGVFADKCEELGVPTPRTLRMTEPGDLDALGDAELPRFFVKPRNSQLFNQRFGVKAKRVTERAQAAELLAQLAGEGHEVLLQEFIPGPPTGHLFLDGYVDRVGTMRACLARRRLRLYPPDFGNSTLSETIPLADASEAQESLERLFEGIGYTGLFDAEFVHDGRDGRFKILEVNARPWWQLELAGVAGLDLTLMAYRDALGLPLPDAAGYRIGRRWIHPLPDLRAWWTARSDGQVLGGFPLRSWFGEANALFTPDDPLPLAEELGRLARRLKPRRPGPAS